jgi:hypothetical protein
MKEIPILYSTAMIQAKLAGRKTQTRRLIDKVNFMHLNKHIADWPLSGFNELKDGIASFEIQTDVDDSTTIKVKCPYGQPGDLLWARETHYYEKYFNGLTEGVFPRYRADFGDEPVDWNWRPNIFLHKEYSRIWDRVVSVRVERLKKISEDDAFAEGIDTENDETYLAAEHCQLGGSPVRGGCPAICAYSALWERINGPGSWESNPWVWVITTENLSLTGKPENV